MEFSPAELALVANLPTWIPSKLTVLEILLCSYLKIYRKIYSRGRSDIDFLPWPYYWISTLQQIVFIV